MGSTRFRSGAAAMVVAGLLALGGCTSTFTAQPYTPGVGTNVDRGAVKVRALVLVVEGAQTYLTGSIVSSADDTLTSIQGKAQDSSFKPLSQLGFNDVRMEVQRDKLITLTDKKIHTSTGDLTPGLTAELQLAFEKSGTATVVVPVVDKNHPDYTTMNPTAAQSNGS